MQEKEYEKSQDDVKKLVEEKEELLQLCRVSNCMIEYIYQSINRCLTCNSYSSNPIIIADIEERKRKFEKQNQGCPEEKGQWNNIVT